MDAKKLHINSSNLAEQQDFIAWVKYGTNAPKWKKWLTDHPEQQPKVDEAKKIVGALQFNPTPLSINKEKLWGRIENSTSDNVVELEQSTYKTKRLYRYSFAAIAASLVLLFGITFLLRQNIEINTISGESITHTLPDNSQIFVNASSAIKYDKRNWNKSRKVKLNGEAFFEVEKGATFTVVTDNGNVQVLGTKFNVFSRDKSLRVKCTEGKVKVTSADGKSIQIIQAGDEVQLDNLNKLQRIPFQAKFDWRKDAYTYNTVALSQVFGEIERQFGVEIKASPQIKAMSFTGSLETKDMDKALYMVTWPMSLSYVISGDKIEIERIR